MPDVTAPSEQQQLADWPLFAGLDAATLQQVASSLRRRVCGPGQVIASEGSPGQALYVVAEGMLRASQLSLEGREHVLAYLGPGECFGLAACINGGDHLATLEASTNAILYELPRDRFQLLMQSNPSFSLAVARQLARNERLLAAKIKDLALYTVRARLARFLLTYAEKSPAQRRWTQETIAAHIGTVRDVVGRILRAFEEEGIIRRERGRMLVLKRKALEREAQL